MSKKLLAIVGFKGSGKDTAANILSDQGFRRVAFADVLKDMVSEQYGIPRQDMDDPNKKEAPLLTLPVEPKDEYSRMLADFFLPEFRDRTGEQPYQNRRPLFSLGVDPDVRLYHTPRSILITEGSTKRFVTSKYWVQRVLKQIKDSSQNMVLTDMRYRSELEQVREFCEANEIDFKFGRILREPPKSEDPSERDLDSVETDFIIDNTGNVGQLIARLDRALMSLGWKKETP